MKILGRAELDARQGDIPTTDVLIPEWGEDVGVRVRGLSQAQRSEWNSYLLDKDGPDAVSLLVVLGAIDENGNQLYKQVQDVDAVLPLRADVVDRIADAVGSLSGLGGKAVEEAKKDSSVIPSAESPSESADTSDAPSES